MTSPCGLPVATSNTCRSPLSLPFFESEIATSFLSGEGTKKSIVVLPLSYLPLMLLAGDKSYMGGYANKWLAKGLGWTYFVVVTIAALAAIPLYLLTSGGQA